MAHIPYIPDGDIPESDRVPDSDHILRIHGVHPATMRQHYDLYLRARRRRMLTPGSPRSSRTRAPRWSPPAEGFADLAIHDICAITAYFAFVNRIADGLGVELERP